MKTSRRTLAKVVAAKLIAEPAKSKSIMKMTAAYLIDNNMADKAHIFVNDLARELYGQTGHISAEVVTAQPATANLTKLLANSIKQLTGAKSVDLNLTEDKAIIGGFIIRTPEAALDSTVRRKLNQLSNIA